MVAKAYEEIKLYISDKEINEQNTLVLHEMGFVNCQFQSLNVGDIVKCENNSQFPADLLLLFSSRDTNDCSVTTVNLDGESNLKTFQGVIHPINENSISEEIKNKEMKINCMKSCEDLHRYQGFFITKDDLKNNVFVLSENNLLLRGARLKHTEFIVGCVVYAGQYTKLSLNSQVKKQKLSTVDSALHIYIFTYFVIQIILAFISCLVANLVYFKQSWFIQNWYIHAIRIGVWKRFEIFLAFFILFNKLLPVSLIFSIYTLKIFASYFFNIDLNMYDEEIDQRARVNTIELIEEMGQIEYLFSDKTGTLTENKMKFHCCSTGDEKYWDINDELYNVIQGELQLIGSIIKQNLLDLFICLCLCHTVKVSNFDGSPREISNIFNSSDLIYQASSPDEEAFLEAFKNYNVIYLGAKQNNHYISIFGNVLCYVVRSVLKFDSTRKCMSVIVDFPDGSTQLICKGAESSLFPLTENTRIKSQLMDDLSEFSREGLRVLVIAKKILSKEEAETFFNKLNHYQFTPSLMDREYEIYPLIENNLILVGVTGVEDKLQDGVRETIRDLKEAGIKIWVITGDKEETAVNISLSAGHIDQSMLIHRLVNIETIDECVWQLTKLVKFVKVLQESSHALVVDGKSFSVLVDPMIVGNFIEAFSYMKVALCCRMTPLQKSQIVQIVKQYVKPTPITAAIGDGGNDVSMILEAHVGIGIFGKEGRQAARIADYAFGKFKFLRPAILVHGQNFYIRLTTYILLFFYKSVLYVAPLFFYCFISAFTALHFYDTVSATLYNITFTTLPIVTYGILEKNLSDETYLHNPKLYRKLSRNNQMNVRVLLKAFILGFIQSSIIFATVYFVYSYHFDFVGTKGQAFDYLVFGLLILYCSWGVLLIKIALVSKTITKIIGIIFIGNIMISFISQLIYQAITVDQENSLVIRTLSEPFSWLLIVIIILICAKIDICLTLHRNFKSMNSKYQEEVF